MLVCRLNYLTTSDIYTLSLHDALPIFYELHVRGFTKMAADVTAPGTFLGIREKIPYLKELGINAIEMMRSEEHTSELQSRFDLVCRLLLEKKKKAKILNVIHSWYAKHV